MQSRTQQAPSLRNSVHDWATELNWTEAEQGPCLQAAPLLLGCILSLPWISSVQFILVTQMCLTLCDPMDCSTPGLPVHHQLPELTQNSYPLSRWCQPTTSFSVVPFSSRLLFFTASGSFPMSSCCLNLPLGIRESHGGWGLLSPSLPCPGDPQRPAQFYYLNTSYSLSGKASEPLLELSKEHVFLINMGDLWPHNFLHCFALDFCHNLTMERISSSLRTTLKIRFTPVGMCRHHHTVPCHLDFF